MRKGMSQTLGLVIAATVLLVTALVAIFIVQGGLTDTEEGVTSSGCVQVLQSKCVDGGSVSAPATCFSNGKPVSIISGSSAENPGDDVSCSSVGMG